MSIGGYFGMELPVLEEYHKNAIRLNTCRNAFEYILQSKAYSKVYLPYYTCDVMLEPILKLNIEYEFYSIDKNFYPIFNFNQLSDSHVFVYNNYFGICEKQAHRVVSECKNIIIDNAQAFYSKPIKNVDTIYSPRKFFGIPDGGYLYTDYIAKEKLSRDISYTRFNHLLGRIDKDAESFYFDYKKTDNDLRSQPIREMSKLTQRMLSSIEYGDVRSKRINNFSFLHKFLEDANQLNIDLSANSVPMVYPYLVDNGNELKRKLIENKVFVATYWPNVREWASSKSFEHSLAANLLALPIDQRYGMKEMKMIIDIMNE